ncbi:hypothetical protein [Candidatus Colwellia aromaticivorans]|uniref:hypothetical protein n=1 Tax=Candidatus Colwellia aromaticivorans TaxID=2267621 RepID=UPI000DF193FD|nr:hypothetical protein [Candidatus Colwellia aromaticivorans]
MSEQYSHRKFFRKVSNNFLMDYFDKKNINFPIDLYALEDNDVDPVFEAFLKLEDDIRHQMESDFQSIHALATDGGIIALTDEAIEFENIGFLNKISSIWGLHNKAMWAFLDSPEYWQAAATFFQASNIPSTSWKVIKDLPRLRDPFKKIDIALLSKAIGEYFFTKEGRGKRCKIEHYSRGKLEYFCAFPEDFAKSETEWISDNLHELPHTMAFEIVFVYCPDNCTLELYAKNNAKNIPQLQRLFVEYIIKEKLTHFTPVFENRVYVLETILEANFEFVLPEGRGIFMAQILRARSTSLINPKSHIIVEECPNQNKHAVHEKLSVLKLDNRYISEVTVKVSFIPRPNKPNQTRIFTISSPDKCNLGHYGDDLIIREMLTLSGIEPQPINLSLPCI